jgi:hypothetical protein
MPDKVPLRVDFAGPSSFPVNVYPSTSVVVVNCAISPTVTLDDWPYLDRSGLADTYARSLLLDADPSAWSDCFLPDFGILEETGLCVWSLDPLKPQPLIEKREAAFLAGKMALWHTGKNCLEVVARAPISAHAESSALAVAAVAAGNLTKLAEAINLTHNIQLSDGMEPLPSAFRSLAYKYVGDGFGGYALYLFPDKSLRDAFCERPGAMAIEPYVAD